MQKFLIYRYFEQILAERENNETSNENNYPIENEIIEEDCMEDRIDSMHFQEQKRKKCRSEEYFFRNKKDEVQELHHKNIVKLLIL